MDRLNHLEDSVVWELRQIREEPRSLKQHLERMIQQIYCPSLQSSIHSIISDTYIEECCVRT
eukprot:43603-Eustigmatos_ZCMA.PRE.1